MKIAISTDHAGFELLRQLEAFLTGQGHTCVDFGPQKFDPGDDYPDFIFPAAQAVASGQCDMGVILGGSGQGEAMAANRIKGVRCAVYYGAAQAAMDADGLPAHGQSEILRLSREHNNANMLSLAARFLSVDEAKQAVTAWLAANFSGDERHKRRIAKLDQAQDSFAPPGPAKDEPGNKTPQDADPAETPKPKPDAVIDGDGTLSVRH